jgi:Tol biopolymer transport system component/predicted Ser/Thr protein kinase
MLFMIGKTLGHYEITSQLGKGGMGEVYQAKDQRLGRDVAIKVLPEEFAKDADRTARFQREAKVLASLNHPNIAAIYGLEESTGTNFLVMELVEGVTLVDQLKRGPIPVEDSLNLALQITEALEAAHEKGIIHRDLKPANIKVTPEGKVKVLDFGLAKAFAGEQSDLNLSNSPTLSNAATQQGVILGTAAYMSPEQAKGKIVDKRADVWAFGCVLFEMLTGRSLFSADDVSQTLARVLERQPDFSSLPPDLHPKIIELLERCLEKEARNRYSGIGDARVDIQKALDDPRGVFVKSDSEGKRRSKWKWVLLYAVGVVVAAAAIVSVVLWKLKPPEPRRVMRFEYVLPVGRQFIRNSVGEVPLTISPDGSHFVYGANGGLYLRYMNDPDARLIPGTDGIDEPPFFSPDSKWIAYVSQPEGKLKKVSVSGGAPIALCDAKSFMNGMWNEDNTIIFTTDEPRVMRVSADGGAPETLAEGKNALYVEPQLLPDGKSMLFTEISSGKPKIMVRSLKSGEVRELFEGENARYLPTGHIVYFLEGNLFAIPFNPDTLQTTGGRVSMIQDVGDYSISGDGTLIFTPGTQNAAQSRFSLVWVDRKGKEEPFAEIQSPWVDLSLSPGGTQLALAFITKGNADVWIRDLLRGTMTRLTFDEISDEFPLWTPDGKRVVFYSQFGRTSKICWKAANGSGEIEQLALVPDKQIYPWSWSGDGKALLLTEITSPGQVDIGMLSIEGDRSRKPLLSDKYNEGDPKISPDGQWMAYTSNESGRNEVYVRPFPEVNKDKWLISTSGGYCPLWAPDGRELFYRNGDAAMAVAVETKPAFKPGKPQILFQGQYFSTPSYATPWDISRPDGKRFVMAKPYQPPNSKPEEILSRKINIVLNWFEELKQRVPRK